MTLNLKRASGYLIVLILLASCFGHEHLRPEKSSPVLPEASYDQYMVPSGSNLLFGHVPGLTLSVDTKSSGSEDLVTLESLIDRSSTVEEYFKDWLIRQIEFKEVDCNQMLLLKDSLGLEMNSMGVVKKFLIEAVNIVSQERFSKIATIIPTDEYCLNHNPETISYLNKPAFRGVIVYGNFDCSLSNIYIYGPHPIQVGRIIDANEAENYEYVRYLSLIDFSNLTKSDNEELEASVCIGVTKPKPWFPEDNSGDDVIETNPGSNVGDLEEPRIGNDDDNFIGGGGSSDNQIDSAKIVEDDKVTYIVELYANVEVGKFTPSDLYVPGLRGAGTYSEGDTTHIGAPLVVESNVFYASNNESPRYVFHWWTGNLPKAESPIQTIVMEKDITATAYYFDVNVPETMVSRPCLDKERGVYNPLVNMSVAPSSSFNIKGGTYGRTRYREDGTLKFHNGLDLAAEVGTPVFSMIEGIISGAKKQYVVEQQDRDENGEYPDHYKGDKKADGNRIYIIGELNGNSISIGYWHLQAGNPVAINPRTGQIYKPGDKVYPGDLIGYTGRTGNANEAYEDHLHLYCAKNGNSCNPEDIINGLLDWQNNKLVSTKIDVNKCDN